MTEHRCHWSWLASLGAALLLLGCATDEPAGAPTAPSESTTPEVADQVPEKEPKAVPKPGVITEIDLGYLLELRDDGKVLLIDVRPSLFHAMGHIPGAVSLPKKKFEAVWPEQEAQVAAAVAAGKVVVLYCANSRCPDGYAVAKMLAPKGYDVSIYKNGWEEWKMAGFE